MAALVGEELLRHSGYEAESSGIWARLLVLPPCCELVHIWAIRAVCPVRNGRMTMALMEGPVTLERREEKKKKKRTSRQRGSRWEGATPSGQSPDSHGRGAPPRLKGKNCSFPHRRTERATSVPRYQSTRSLSNGG